MNPIERMAARLAGDKPDEVVTDDVQIDTVTEPTPDVAEVPEVKEVQPNREVPELKSEYSQIIDTYKFEKIDISTSDLNYVLDTSEIKHIGVKGECLDIHLKNEGMITVKYDLANRVLNQVI